MSSSPAWSRPDVPPPRRGDLPPRARDARRRILLVSENDLLPEMGGMETRGKELYERLQQSYEMALLAHSGLTFAGRLEKIPVADRAPEEPHETVSQRLRRRLNSAGRRISAVTRRLRAIRSLRPVLAELRPDLVYLHKFGEIHAAIICELVALPAPAIAFFGDQHGTRLATILNGEWPQGLARKMLYGGSVPPRETPDRVTLVFNCDFLRRFYTTRFAIMPDHFVIHMGVDSERFHPAISPLESARFAFLGRVVREKGFLDFCNAMAVLPPELIDAIDVIGDGPALNEGLEILRSSGRSNLLGRVGFVPHAAVPQRLHSASILVHPSHEEGLPASVLEAMASGLGVIASDVGGTSEVVHHGKTGLLIPPHHPASLVRACKTLAETPALRKRLGRNARQLVASRYRASTEFDTIVRLIENVIESRHHTGEIPAPLHI